MRSRQPDEGGSNLSVEESQLKNPIDIDPSIKWSKEICRFSLNKISTNNLVPGSQLSLEIRMVNVYIYTYIQHMQ